jgi:hypothetical protein
MTVPQQIVSGAPAPASLAAPQSWFQPTQDGATAGAQFSRCVQQLCARGRTAEARGIIEAHLRRHDGRPAGLLNDLGVLLIEEGLIDAGLGCLLRALRSRPDVHRGSLLFNVAYALSLGGRTASCTRFCTRASYADAGDSRPHYLKCVVESAGETGRSRSCVEALRAGDGVGLFKGLRLWDDPAGRYKAVVTNAPGPALSIAAPALMTRAGAHWGVLIRFGGELWCGFTRQTGARPAGPGLNLPLPECMHVVQRRQWVRVAGCGALVGVEVADPPGGGGLKLLKIQEVNLSAGGAAIRTVPELPVETRLVLLLNLGSGPAVRIPARVIRIVRPEGCDAYLALRFERIPEPLRERIARYLHQVQLQRRRAKA